MSSSCCSIVLLHLMCYYYDQLHEKGCALVTGSSVEGTDKEQSCWKIPHPPTKLGFSSEVMSKACTECLRSQHCPDLPCAIKQSQLFCIERGIIP